MSIYKLPCKDCITLPICKNVFRKHKSLKDLCIKCSIIDKYTDNPDIKGMWHARNRNKLLYFFSNER